MTTFSLKDGDLKKVSLEGRMDQADLDWFSEQIMVRDDILPEKLLIISKWDDESGAGGFLALDGYASLAVVLVSGQSPKVEWISKAAGLAWDLRYAGYDDLNNMAGDYFEKNGLATGDLAELHKHHFLLDEQVRPARFNQNQRMIVIAPTYSKSAIEKLRWQKFEIDVKAYLIQFIDLDTGDRFLNIEPLSLLERGSVATLFSLLVRVPVPLKDKSPGNEDDAGPEPDDIKLPKSFEYAALIAMICLYIAVFSFLTIRNHNNFGTFGFDLGVFDQGVWLLSHFKDPFITVRGLHLFADRLSFILILFAPLYRIWDDVRVLLILQTIILATGAIPVYLIAKERLKSTVLSLSLAASFLLYPALQWLNSDQFHPESVATTCLLFAFYYALRTRYLAFAIFTLLAMLTGQNIAFVIGAMGLYVAATKNRKVGFSVSSLALIWLVVGVKVGIPHFSGMEFQAQNYARSGLAMAEVINNFLINPGDALSVVFQQKKLVYLMQLLAPVIFLPLASVGTFLVALPDLFANLASQHGYVDSIRYHYSAAIIPFIFISSIFAIERLALSQRGLLTLAGVIIAVSLIANYTLSPSPVSQNFNQSYWNIRSSHKKTIEAALSLIPKDAPVSAVYYMVPHLSHREKIYEFPNPFMTANWGFKGENPHNDEAIEYVIVDLSSLPEDQRLLITKLRNKNFMQIFSKQQILVLKRR